MKNLVSYETAKRLKEAGFPQPPFQVGQNWYDTGGELFWVKCDESPYVHGEWWGDDHCGFVEIPHGDEVFAPTSSDILAELYPVLSEAKDILRMALDPEKAAAEWIKAHEKKDLQE